MNGPSLEELFKKYYEKKASAEEQSHFFRMLNQTEDEELSALIRQMGMNGETKETVISAESAKLMMEKILRETRPRPVVRRLHWWRYASAAAAVLVLIVAGGYWLGGGRKQVAAPQSPVAQQDPITPGGNKAILTLADGRQIVLDNAANGDLATEANMKIIKLSDGRIGYEGHEQGNAVAYNTISTPVGGQYQVVLADGTRVWLNATSSLRFPAAFTGTERVVELKGEGYFEVAHDAAKPFYVKVDDMDIQVLGTHFNVNAYNDEPQLKTTLLEGKVRIENAGSVRFLKPGQQAMVDGSGKMELVDNADLAAAVAWKNGKFVFNDCKIPAVMRQLARWYDIDVNYANDLTDDEFNGVIPIPRTENISAVLSLLQKTKTVSFKVTGKTVTVTPYKSN